MAYAEGHVRSGDADRCVPADRQAALPRTQEKLTDKNDEWTKHARKLDKISIKAYLDQFRGKAEDWALDLIDVAYNIEFGLLTEDQSSLAMVDFIGTDLEKPFEMFGESDEKWRIKGGSSVLINALVDRLKDKIEMKQGWSLNALDYKGGQIVMGFDAPGGPQDAEFRRGDPHVAVHQAAAVQRSRELAAQPGEAEDHSRAGLRDECQGDVRHQVAGMA